MKRVYFCGLGSIAGRHIINLKQMYGDDISITVVRSGNGGPVDESLHGKIDCIVTEENEEWYDAVFITNPTYKHYETLKKNLLKSDFFFIEKPVFLTGEEELTDLLRKDKSYYVACPLRYTKVIQYLKNKIDFSKVHGIRCISSSYLPKWRKGKDYRTSYSSYKDKGGGVHLDLVHEWDYINYLVGMPVSLKCIFAKKSDLEIDSNDIAVYIAEYSDKIVEVHLDYFGRVEQRRIELYTDEDMIVADLIKMTIKYMKTGQEISFKEDRNDYQKKELEHFMSMIDGKIKSDNDIEEACRVVKLARGVI